MRGDIELRNVVDDDIQVRDSLTKDLSQIDISEELKEVSNNLNANGSEDFIKEIYLEMKKKDPNAVCPSCGGKPMKGESCTTCGKGNLSEDITNIDEMSEQVVQELFIPEKYLKEKFNSSVLKSSHEDLQDNQSFNKYTRLLDSILDRINRGVLEKSSLYISAPSGFGKETFAYTAIQLAKSRGLTVFPYLDLMEANRLMEAYEQMDMKESLKRRKEKFPIIEDIKFTDLDMYRSDLCILKVPHSNVSMTNYQIMLKIIDRRARRGLPTITLSRYNFNFFTMLDTQKETAGIISYNNPSHKNLQVFETNGK